MEVVVVIWIAICTVIAVACIIEIIRLLVKLHRENKEVVQLEVERLKALKAEAESAKELHEVYGIDLPVACSERDREALRELWGL